MRLWIFAIGSARGSSEGALCDEYIGRALKLGRNIGFSAVHIEELSVGKARDAKTRMADEADRLAALENQKITDTREDDSFDRIVRLACAAAAV